jgi:hypothetical protein
VGNTATHFLPLELITSGRYSQLPTWHGAVVKGEAGAPPTVLHSVKQCHGHVLVEEPLESVAALALPRFAFVVPFVSCGQGCVRAVWTVHACSLEGECVQFGGCVRAVGLDVWLRGGLR